MNGQGFTPGSTVQIYLSLDSVNTPAGQATADAAGKVSQSITVPLGTVIGSYQVVLSGTGPNGSVNLTSAVLSVTVNGELPPTSQGVITLPGGATLPVSVPIILALFAAALALLAFSLRRRRASR